MFVLIINFLQKNIFVNDFFFFCGFDKLCIKFHAHCFVYCWITFHRSPSIFPNSIFFVFAEWKCCLKMEENMQICLAYLISCEHNFPFTMNITKAVFFSCFANIMLASKHRKIYKAHSVIGSAIYSLLQILNDVFLTKVILGVEKN